MTTDVTTRPLRAPVVTIALLSAALVAFQLLVLRVAAIRMQFENGLMLVGNCLLGIAAASSLLSLCERSWRLLPDAWVRRCCLGFFFSLPLSWAWLLAMPMPAVLGGDGTWLRFLGFCVASAVPCAFAGGAVAVLLAANVRGVHAVSGALWLGGGLACVFTPMLLWHTGAGGCFLATAVLATAAAASAGPMDAPVRAILMLLCTGAGWLMPHFDRLLPVAGHVEVELAGKQVVRLPERPEWSQWSAPVRVDVAPIADAAPAAVPAGETAALPVRQLWLAIDGGKGAVIVDHAADPRAAATLLQRAGAAALHLRQGAGTRICVLGLGGGEAAWMAKLTDASRIRIVEGSAAVVAAHRTQAAEFSAPLLSDPRVELVVDDGRGALLRSDERHDVILVDGIETRTSLASGVKGLAADSSLSVDAIAAMLDRLEEGGLLQIRAMPGGAPALRLLVNIWAALPAADRPQFPNLVAVLREGPEADVAVLVRKGAFPAGEAVRLRQFAAGARLDAIALPDAQLQAAVEVARNEVLQIQRDLQRLDQEIGRRNEGVDDAELQRLRGERLHTRAPLLDRRARLRLAEFVLAPDKEAFLAQEPLDIGPTTDDAPWFWDFGGARTVGPDDAATPSDSGPVLLQVQLWLALLAAALCVTLPLVFRSGAVGQSRSGALRYLGYFAGSALAAVGLHVAIVQKLALLLGQPLHSISITMASLFVFAGFGASASRGLLAWEPERGRVIALLLFVGAALIAFFSPAVVDLCIGLDLTVRIVVVALVAGPMGLLLGMPFAHGLCIVERANPGLVPWAFAVTASGVAIGAPLAMLTASTFGYAAVLFAAGVAFLLAFACIDTLARNGATAAAPPAGGPETHPVTP